MIILIKLVLAYLTVEYIIKPQKWDTEFADLKAKSLKFYAKYFLLAILGVILSADLKYIPLILLTTLGLGTIEIIKLYSFREKGKGLIVLLLSQLVFIGVFCHFWERSEINIEPWLQNQVLWVNITAIIFLTAVCGKIIQTLMAKWSIALSENEDESLTNAGKYIGMLERLFVFTFVLTGHWEAVGFLLAAKSVFRFGDLKESKDRKLTEYILIGTLLSFGLAILIGIIAVSTSSQLNLK